ncbi:MAG: cupredoxin domain-containing protein [Gammaproteobacteria bacterium]|nr:cupredoxin domain-containing protein [Gammaproteobacteria bacterium]
MTTLLINLAGVALIVAIVWWFWLYKPSEPVTADASNHITVENGVYQPARIQIAAGKPVTLSFLRKDASGCAEEVIFPDLDVSKSLALNEATSVELPSLENGTYPFHCQMNMYRGELIVT